MDLVKSTFTRTKEFVSDHKVAIVATVAVVATAALSIAVQRSAIKDWNEFLEQEGLIEKFYNPGS